MNRRQFLGWAWFASLTAFFGQILMILFRYLKPNMDNTGFGARVVAGRLNEFQPGTINHVQKGRFYISRLEDGSLLAVWHRCTHLGCTVPWREEEGIFHCPCHGSLFNVVGEVLGGPAPRPLDIFPIEIVDGEVIVDTGTVIQRQAFDPSQVTHTS